MPKPVGAATPVTQRPSSLVAEIWSYNANQKMMVPTRYVVDAAGTLVASEVPVVDEYGPLRQARKRADVLAFDQLEARIHAVGGVSPGDDLAAALKQIEKNKSWGTSPGDQLLASPDGTHAVLFPTFGIPLVVDIGTLQTARLLRSTDPVGIPTHLIPMAWSPDSTLLAFAPLDAGAIVLYKVSNSAIQSTINTQGQWVQAIAWSPDMRKLVLLNLINRRLKKTPLGLLSAGSGHPDFRNDLILVVRPVSGTDQLSVRLKSDLTEQSSYDYWINWQ